jgi:hypothetical protein
MAESPIVSNQAETTMPGAERRTLMEALVRASLGLQGVSATQTRISEIAVEAARLSGDLSNHVGCLTYYDEPSHYAAFMRDEKVDE